MKNSLSILVPVDFSDYAVNAYRYAINLAEHLGASIKLIHINTEILPASRPTSTIKFPQTMTGLRKKIEQFAEQNHTRNQGDTIAVKTETEVVQGITVTSELIEQSKNFDLIVVGAKGENLLTKRLLGSVPTLLSQKSHCSVLVIPMEAEFYPPAKILYASNWESSDGHYIEECIKWSNHFNSQTTFLHITQEYAAHEFEEIKEKIFETLEEQEDIHFSYLIIDKKAFSPLSAIMIYAKKESMDWIIVANRQKGFFSNLLGLSMTNEIATNPQNPILVLKK